MTALRRLAASKVENFQHVVLWGSGGLGRQALREWLPAGKARIIIDSNVNRHSSVLDGIDIVAPEHFPLGDADCVIVATTAYLEVCQQLAALGYRGATLNAYELLLSDDHESMDELTKLKVDIAVQKSGSWFEFLLDRPQIWSNITYRLCRHARNRRWIWPLQPLLRIWHSLATSYLSIYLPLDVEAGPGLAFAHYGTIVFRAGVRLGAFCTLYHNATLGSDETGEKPIIGNFVTIYTGSTLVGDCVLGDYTRVGAHTLGVGLKAEGHCTVVGNPARIVRRYADAAEPDTTMSEDR